MYSGGHCQVPCGIYDDNRAYSKLREDAATIEKAVDNINSLAGKGDPQAINQSIRWTLTKEDHADAIINAISEYFLAQRLKPSRKNYEHLLKAHHRVILDAVAVKQTVSREQAVKLRKSINSLVKLYNGSSLLRTRRKPKKKANSASD